MEKHITSGDVVIDNVDLDIQMMIRQHDQWRSEAQVELNIQKVLLWVQQL